MTQKPDNCCVDGCGRPTQSHNIAVDVSDHDVIGMPTLAGVVCHRCWTGETGEKPPMPELIGESGGDPRGLLEHLDEDAMVLTAVPAEELADG